MNLGNFADFVAVMGGIAGAASFLIVLGSRTREIQDGFKNLQDFKSRFEKLLGTPDVLDGTIRNFLKKEEVSKIVEHALQEKNIQPSYDLEKILETVNIKSTVSYGKRVGIKACSDQLISVRDNDRLFGNASALLRDEMFRIEHSSDKTRIGDLCYGDKVSFISEKNHRYVRAAINEIDCNLFADEAKDSNDAHFIVVPFYGEDEQLDTQPVKYGDKISLKFEFDEPKRIRYVACKIYDEVSKQYIRGKVLRGTSKKKSYEENFYFVIADEI